MRRTQRERQPQEIEFRSTWCAINTIPWRISIPYEPMLPKWRRGIKLRWPPWLNDIKPNEQALRRNTRSNERHIPSRWIEVQKYVKAKIKGWGKCYLLFGNRKNLSLYTVWQPIRKNITPCRFDRQKKFSSNTASLQRESKYTPKSHDRGKSHHPQKNVSKVKEVCFSARCIKRHHITRDITKSFRRSHPFYPVHWTTLSMWIVSTRATPRHIEYLLFSFVHTYRIQGLVVLYVFF